MKFFCARDKEIDRINALPASDQGPAWMALDKKIMTDCAPVVPLHGRPR